MTQTNPLGFVTEPQKDVPVAYDVDVVVVGAGLSGLFSALAAGRLGVKTLLIDRFGVVGGNLGPAMIVGAPSTTNPRSLCRTASSEFQRNS